MIPDPLHPAVVHFPIVLAVFLPLVALATLWAIYRGAAPRRAWAITTVVAVLLTVSSWFAVRTGEAQEDVVERVVAEEPIEEHEHAAERFLLLTAALAVVTAAGLLAGNAGRAARGLATAGAVALLAVAFQTGHTGGELVYRHGAGAAYSAGTLPSPGGPADAIE